MVDQERVCCMCGDVGFADKLFRCSHCRFRFQHLYCSNYYYGSQELLSPSSSSTSSSMTKSMEICDWCQSEGRNNSSNSKSFKRSSSSSSMDHHHHNTSSERIKHHHHNNNTSGERVTHKNNSGVPSPRPSAHRRYKLLKDVMC
ncbi:hypothetical protein RDABS01_008395 [Bienertia sinuspersici]